MRNKNNAYLKDENLLTLFSLNNLIVPEIQREYVWGNNPDVLDKFLEELEGKAIPCDTCYHVHCDKNINVGFLYSYKPLYVKYETDRILDEYLIDGQQRITTLFLLLLYRATIEERLEDFLSIIRADELSFDMAFNYKVRNLTQQFILQLIKHAKDIGKDAFNFVNEIDNDRPYWFLDDYRADKTVESMVKALGSIIRIFGNPYNYYFDFLLTNIHFWHFKTEATSQGEELYITMNSRGEQLTDNEMKKARTLPANKMINYGEKWEQWQTFFWRNRKRNGNNINSDKGFDNFLACIDNYLSFTNCINMSNGESDAKINAIEKIMNGLETISDYGFQNKVAAEYPNLYLDWYKDYLNILWNEINNYSGRWDLINPKGQDEKIRADYNNKSVLRNKSMLFWPWMYYFQQVNDVNDIDLSTLIRLLHFFYIRYCCYKRSSTTIDAVVKAFIETSSKIHLYNNSEYPDEGDDYSSNIFSEEELFLSDLVCKNGDDKRIQLESLIWEIQHLPYFSDGKDVGGNTILNFVRDDEIINKEDIEFSLINFKKNIKKILTNSDSATGNIIIKELLLFYKSKDNNAFWERQSPNYYYNYETSVWKRIVRNECFLQLYKDLIDYNLDENINAPLLLLGSKRSDFFQTENILNNQLSHRKLAIIYDYLCDDSIWNNRYRNIAFNESAEGNPYGLLPNQKLRLWKLNTNFKSNYEEITLPLDWKNKLTANYPQIKIIYNP
jgi:hypothetical protein